MYRPLLAATLVATFAWGFAASAWSSTPIAIAGSFREVYAVDTYVIDVSERYMYYGSKDPYYNHEWHDVGGDHHQYSGAADPIANTFFDAATWVASSYLANSFLGQSLGRAIGGALGSFFGPVGTVIGVAAGGAVGAGFAYDVAVE